MTIHTEINFENAICEHLANHGWLYADGDASPFDRAFVLQTPFEMFAFTGMVDVRKILEKEAV